MERFLHTSTGEVVEAIKEWKTRPFPCWLVVHENGDQELIREGTFNVVYERIKDEQ